VAGQPRPWWGWHQLDRRWATRLVADAAVRPGELVLDIGAGSGVLTDALLEAGARVIAFELHPRRAARLRARFSPAAVTVVQADAADLRLPRRGFRVVANPPFGVVQAVLRRLVAPGSRLTAADLVVPRYVARQWTSPRAPGRRRWGHDYSVRTGRPVPRCAFVPPPPRGAELLVIRRLET
jgi:23S rRNA (adenine-N6)-dimethyltransferase